MKVIVLAQGRSSRLPGKHHLEVGGEPILGRVLRMASEVSDDVVLVARNVPEYQRYGAAIYTDERPAGNVLDRLWNTRQLWGGDLGVGRESLVLLGDVVYSPGTLWGFTTRCEFPRGLGGGGSYFVGRTVPNRHTGKVGPEIYALRLDPAGTEALRAHLEVAEHRLARGGKLWGLREYGQFKLWGWAETGDYTDDVDTMEDYRAMQRLADQSKLI